MTTDDSKSLALFEQQTIRRVWHNDEWYYSIVDVIAVLTESSNPRNYGIGAVLAWRGDRDPLPS